MSAIDGVPAELLTEPCDVCGGKGFVEDKDTHIDRFDVSRTVAVRHRRCEVCNGTGKIRLNERAFDESATSHSLQRQIDDLRFKNELNSGAVSLLKTEHEQMKSFLAQARQILLNCKLGDQNIGWIQARKSWLDLYEKNFRGVG